MLGKRLHPGRQILGVDAPVEPVAAERHGRAALTEDKGGLPEPFDPVGGKIPVVDEVAGRLDGCP